jgi:hypothetical protein
VYKEMQLENKKLKRGRKAAKNAVGWDGAIALAKRKIKRLEASIRAFEIYRDAGEPWPGTSKAEEQDRAVKAD